MKTSEKLYDLNRQISLLYIAMQKTPQPHDIRKINNTISECIKEVRELEDTVEDIYANQKNEDKKE